MNTALHPTELVEKYILNPDGVVEHPESLDALLQFGAHPDSQAALSVAAERVVKQFYGKGFAFLATREEDDSAFSMTPLAKRLPLNGSDASLARHRRLPRGRGLLWAAASKSQTQLVVSGLSNSSSYVELSKETRALLNVPIVTRGGTQAVLSIESSERRDFEEPQTRRMITNLTQLVVVYRLNTEIGRLLDKTDELAREGLELRGLLDARSQVEQDAVFGFGETLDILAALSVHRNLPLYQIVCANGHSADLFRIVCRLSILGLIAYDEHGFVSLTPAGWDAVAGMGIIDDGDFPVPQSRDAICGG